MDKTGKLGFAEVTIIKDEQAIPGYDLFYLLISLTLLGITIQIKIKDKILKKKN